MTASDPTRPARAHLRLQDLLRDGLAPGEDAGLLAQADARFAVRLTPEMRAALAHPGDGVAAQFVPRAAELIAHPDDLPDPIGDAAHAPVPGLTHRYPDRAILHVTQTCDVHCRFCFRRETVGGSGPLPAADLDRALGYIAATPQLSEIILTGGDPLTLSPRRLGGILARLSEIAHVATLRIHSRVPVVAPGRIDAGLIAALRGARPALWLVVHTNHAQELTPPARAALARLSDAGVPLLSQSVLLRGVNDTPAALATLFRTLLACRVKPYYLHHCDLAPGTAHFRTTLAEGRALMAALRGRISGTALPRYVLDIPGGHGKVPITADHVAPGDRPGLWRVTDWQGRVHDYADPDA
ncbi:lysine-2,3-aminomutase-like protein [Phaeovulum vinaykumarii]|uniref:L-lysine 2,3-aminomutase n=1 Tax=Phaeovulum vinaykumarii TaxID=407234 RepID=A0A1N7JSC0_9RHOB|nr:lysine-2,3-aminomutase-like protein [Phaeovulum vinaykumarii]SIS52230.1 L-lysine 2,3-aminomutase [Phaeovulum vinaykumarii]SOB91137.1 L-lysine 2,3-aminomutase [Phaeovulum vinaykumarii]